MRELATAAGHWMFPMPTKYGGRNGSNLAMAVIRWHLARKGLGLFNDLQNESSIVGNIPTVLMFEDFATQKQKDYFIPAILAGKARVAFGLTEPKHGSDANYMETRGVKDPATGDWILNGAKMWNSGMQWVSPGDVDLAGCGVPVPAHQDRRLSARILNTNDLFLFPATLPTISSLPVPRAVTAPHVGSRASLSPPTPPASKLRSTSGEHILIKFHLGDTY